MTLAFDSTRAEAINGSAVIGKITRRLMPFLFLLYVVNYIDRANVSFTKQAMQRDLHLTDSQYGFAAGIFFLGYALLEIPSNLALRRFGARRWIARIVLSWGLVAAAMALARGSTGFAALRALLGAAEAGFMPGIILYLTQWFPRQHRARAFGAFLTSTALSGVVGSPLSARVLKLDGALHLHGWQWVFLLEGLACAPLAAATLWWLPDSPREAQWLSAPERDWLARQLAAEHHAGSHNLHHLRHALAEARVWQLAALYFLLISGLFGFIFWAPDVLRDHQGGFITAIPYAVGALAMILIGRRSDARDERRWHVAGCALIGGVGMAAAAFSHRPVAGVLSLSVAAVGIWGCLGPFWAMPTAFLKGNAAAGGIALVNSIGCTAGFVTPYVIGLIKQRTGQFGGFYFVTALLLAGAVLALLQKSPPDPRPLHFEPEPV